MKGESKATKSRWPVVDKFFPIVVDDFFDNPDVIRNLGLSLEKEQVGEQPGLRSKQLWEIDGKLHNEILTKILSCYFDTDYFNITWESSNMNFHENESFHEAKTNIANKGWIHQDVDVMGSDQLAGLIYLTPDIDQDSGTSLYKLKPDAWIKPIAEEKEDYLKHRAKFDRKLEFKNFYNRLVTYDTQEWHGASSYWSDPKKDNRMTLTFFIGGIQCQSDFPLKRMKSI